jgi:hypothetical protein
VDLEYLGCKNGSGEAKYGVKMREGLVRFTSVVTVEEYEILIKLAETLKCSRAAAMRMLIETGAKHLEIRG